jgi:hypothetical protein
MKRKEQIHETTYSWKIMKLKKQKEACVILDKLETEFPKRSADSLKRAAEARENFNCKK